MIKAALYCRVPYCGTLSIFEQEMALLPSLPAANASLYAIYVDSFSEDLPDKRPAFSLLVSDAKKGLFQMVFCLKEEMFGAPPDETFPVPVHFVQQQ